MLFNNLRTWIDNNSQQRHLLRNETTLVTCPIACHEGDLTLKRPVLTYASKRGHLQQNASKYWIFKKEKYYVG